MAPNWGKLVSKLRTKNGIILFIYELQVFLKTGHQIGVYLFNRL
ncbi:hypothetical protein AQEC111735_11770 [Aquirufa ecclesiirivi]